MERGRLWRSWASGEKTQVRATWISYTLALGQVNEGAAPVFSFTKQGMQAAWAARAQRSGGAGGGSSWIRATRRKTGRSCPS